MADLATAICRERARRVTQPLIEPGLRDTAAPTADQRAARAQSDHSPSTESAPLPWRTNTGTSPDKSTMVVGSRPQWPPSSTQAT